MNLKILVFCELLTLFAVVYAQCSVFVNEINVIDPKKPEKKEFIEIKTDCADTPLRGYKIIGISAFKKGAARANIVFVANLWNERFSGNLYTICGTDVEKCNMRITSDYVKFRNSWNKDLVSISNFLMNGNVNIHAIDILYAKNDPMSTIQLEKNKNTIPIDENMKKFLKRNLIDLVVYAEKCDCERCNIFEELHPEFANKKYTLREFNFKDDFSLNRCGIENDGFIPERFKIGKPTPGVENDCSGMNFFFENHIQEILPNVISSVASEENDVELLDNNECTSSIRQEDYHLASDHRIEEVVTAAYARSSSNQCTQLQLNPDGGNLMEEIVRGNTRKRRLSDTDYSETLEWETEMYFE